MGQVTGTTFAIGGLDMDLCDSNFQSTWTIRNRNLVRRFERRPFGADYILAGEEMDMKRTEE